MIFSVIEKQKPTSLIRLYLLIKKSKSGLRKLCLSPLSAQKLLKIQSELSDGGALSFYPTESGYLLLCIQGENYAAAHRSAQAIKRLLPSLI